MDQPHQARDANGAVNVSIPGLTSMFGYLDEMVLTADIDGTLRFGAGARDLLGYEPAAAVGRNLLDFLHPEDHQLVLDGIPRWTGRRAAVRGRVVRIRHSAGHWKELRFDAVIGEPGGPLGDMIITLRDPEAAVVEVQAEQAWIMNEQRLVRLASAFLEVPVEKFDHGLEQGLAELGSLPWVTRVSVWTLEDERREQLVRRGVWTAPRDAPGRSFPSRIHLDELELVRRAVDGEEVNLTVEGPDDVAFQTEFDLMRAAGVTSSLAVPMTSGGGFIGLILVESTLQQVAYDAEHVTTLRSAAPILAGAFVHHRSEKRMAEQARTDSVTGLGNRWAFDEALDRALMAVEARRSRGLGLAIIDLDRFKVVNDSLGHAAGDSLLSEIAVRLRRAADVSTVVARLGGDELLVLLAGSPTVTDAHGRLEALLEVFETPFEVRGEVMAVTVSAGLAHTRSGAIDAGELLRRADVAMYRAKANGGNTIRVHSPDEQSKEGSRLRRELDLRRALEKGELTVHYQGEWNLRGGGLVGAEALVRWKHPTEGLLTAGAFVPLAEEIGLIGELGSFVLERACRQATLWRELLGPTFTLRVNIAAEQLRKGDLAGEVADVLSRSGLDPSALCLELTETTLLADPEGSAAVFDRIRAQGVGLAIDDFGTGYSSMVQLRQLPLTALKIDQTFVAGLPHSRVDRAIIRSMVQLAEALGADVTAEGVETHAQREALVGLGCHRAQGFLLCRPESADEFTARVHANLGSEAGTRMARRW